MASVKKTLEAVLRARSDSNIQFRDLRQLLLSLGFEERTRGGHHLFRKEGIAEKINLQRAGNMAKPYQVRQVRKVILAHGLGGETHE